MGKPRHMEMAGVMLSLPALAVAAVGEPQDLASMSLEELSDVRVISVSRREERLGDAPAAIFVISAEDIRRSGARSLAEALRLAPNLFVATSSAGNYIVTSRGLAGSTGNKELVMIDGRSVYTPLYSGVFWDMQDLPLESIERIEVVSGPGGTLWGTNAVNGVINVITKPATATQGAWLDASWGQAQSGASFRYGGAMPSGLAWRVYGMDFAVPSTERADGSKQGDAWHKAQAGFRADWRDGGDSMSVQGDTYSGRKGQPVTPTAPVLQDNLLLKGANLLAHWNRRAGDGSGWNVQAYYDRTHRTMPGTFEETLDIIDLQVLHQFATFGRHEVAAGAGYRYAKDKVTNGPAIQFLPAQTHLSWSSLFAQDGITLSDALKLTVGVRLERNIYTGTEVLPNARLAWKPDEHQLWWAALSRTVRAPARLDRDTFISVPQVSLVGGPGFESETARFAELGYRRQWGSRASLSVNLYRASYDHLRTVEMVAARTAVIGNGMQGSTRGIEAWASFQATRDWRLGAGWSALHQEFSLVPGSRDIGRSLATVASDPHYMASLRSSLAVRGDLDMDATLRRVGKLPGGQVAGYTALDLRLAWRPRTGTELAVGASNAVGGGHGEFGADNVRSEMGRGAFVQLQTRF